MARLYRVEMTLNQNDPIESARLRNPGYKALITAVERVGALAARGCRLHAVARRPAAQAAHQRAQQSRPTTQCRRPRSDPRDFHPFGHHRNGDHLHWNHRVYARLQGRLQILDGSCANP